MYIHIREDLAYTKHTREPLVYNTNNHLRFQHLVEGEKIILYQTLAKTMMAIMVQELFSYMISSLAILVSREINCMILCGRLYQSELIRFRVLALSADCTLTNHCFFHKLSACSSDIVYKVPNPFSDDG